LRILASQPCDTLIQNNQGSLASQPCDTLIQNNQGMWSKFFIAKACSTQQLSPEENVTCVHLLSTNNSPVCAWISLSFWTHVTLS
jgi:hypothetical protein